MSNTNEINFDINNNPLERSKLLQISQTLFKPYEKVMVSFVPAFNSPQIFNNITDALMWVFMYVRENGDHGVTERFTSCKLFNLRGTNNSYSIEFGMNENKKDGSYNLFIHKLGMYEYKYVPEEENEKDIAEIGSILNSPESPRDNLFSSVENKMKYFIKEMQSSNFRKEFTIDGNPHTKVNTRATSTKMTRMLDRYFGAEGWECYWYTSKRLSSIAVELTLNVRLKDGIVIKSNPIL